jgi:hypothetical protein
MTKELLECGIMKVVTHECNECKTGLCLLCALMHKQRHPNHSLKQVISKTSLQMITKKNSHFEHLLNSLVNDRIRDSVDCEISKINSTMKQIFKITQKMN